MTSLEDATGHASHLACITLIHKGQCSKARSNQTDELAQQEDKTCRAIQYRAGCVRATVGIEAQPPRVRKLERGLSGKRNVPIRNQLAVVLRLAAAPVMRRTGSGKQNWLHCPSAL